MSRRPDRGDQRHPWRRTLLSAAVLLLLAVPAGVLWERWAEPARWEVTEQGAILTQRAAQGQFGVELWFILVGTVLCLVWGVAAGVLDRDLGWWLGPVFAVTAAVASVVAWQVGVHLGPPDPTTVDDVSLGDTFPDQLELQSFASFLVWPCAALGGLVLGLVASVDRAPHPEEPAAG